MDLTKRKRDENRWSFVVLSVALATAWSAAQESRPTSVPTPPDIKLRIELKTDTPVVEAGGTPRFRAELVNDGAQAVAVVLPRDGSESGWRTPVIRWDPVAPTTTSRCAQFCRATAKDVITLGSGGRIGLRWIDCPSLRVGKNWVSLELENIPDLTVRLAESEPPPAVEEVRATPRFRAKSNVVEVELKADPYREHGRSSTILLNDVLNRQWLKNRWLIELPPGSDEERLHSVEHHFLCRTHAQADQVVAWGAARGYRASPVLERSEPGRLIAFELIKDVPLTRDRLTSETTLMLEAATTFPVMYNGWEAKR